MGCKSCLWRFLKFTAFCLVITFLPGLPPSNVEYKEHIVKKPQPLGADFAAQTHLNNAERLFEGNLVGPEAFAVYKNALYTGVQGGFVIRIDSEGIAPIVKFGKDCGDISEESICGRPLGLKFDKEGNLYVVDAYYGLFKYNMKGASSTRLVDVNDVIEGKKSKFMNDLAVASDGSVYFTVSSTSFTLEDGVQVLLAPGDGRLMKYDPKARTTIVLAEDLFFPNGIVLSPNEDFLLFSETTHLRVLKYNLKGPQKGKIEVFADGLPGAPDNIRSDGHDGYYVSLVVSADPTHPFLPQMLAPFPNIRRFLSRVLALVELPFIEINRFFPNSICQKAAHAIGHFGPTRYLTPKTSTILQLDSQGGIKNALVGTDGTASHISDMAIIGENILLGSPYNNFIARVPLAKAPYRVTVKSVKFTEEGKEDESKIAQEAKVKKAAEEAKRAVEEAKAKKAAEEAKQAAEQAKAKKAAEEAKRAAEESKAKKAAEEARAKKAAEETKRAAEEARAKKIAEEAKAKKAAEEAKRAVEEAKAKKAAEEAKQAAEQAKAKKVAEEAKRAAEESKAKKAAEEARAKKAAEETKRAAEEAKAKKVAEEAKRAAEQAKVKKAAEEAKRAAEEAKAKKIAEEAKAKKANEIPK